ncbi:glycosyltransferase family 4 protein [Massilia sp. DWR3-1-1]|uniref:glycosyltransferase family 4 protein n=1 Tax=Massilia sp. DWR3-1-1 TaxID=2804559 RepID=UPI003CF4CF0C
MLNSTYRAVKVVHLTSVHGRGDTRIFVKQCRTLADHAYRVTLVVADGLGEDVLDGITITDVGRPQGRLQRMLRTTYQVYRRALALDGDIYHLHDPELIPVGLRLKRMGKVVIFDAHEDVPKQLLNKPYLPTPARKLVSLAYSQFEQRACAKLDGIVAATPSIRDKFLLIHPGTVDVNNYPLPSEFDASASWIDKSPEVCYVGGIGATRGIRQLVQACELMRTPTRLSLAGNFSESKLESEITGLPGWQRVIRHGHLDRGGVRRVMARAVAGLVTLHPISNYLDALPVKMFEYMAAGIPVIASNFPLWQSIIHGERCGLCVDPLDPQAIADAIDYLVSHPQVAREMGANGRRAILASYNWAAQATRLIDFYGAIANAKKIRVAA